MGNLRFWMAGTLAALTLVACQSGGSELSPQDEAQLKDNISRDLTPEEVGKISGNTAAQQDPSGMGAPPPSKD